MRMWSIGMRRRRSGRQRDSESERVMGGVALGGGL